MKFKALFFTFLAALAVTAAASAGGYRITKTIPLAGDGGWDYLLVDESARRVYVSHSTQVEVLDADTGAIKGKIANLKGVHGVAVAPEFGRGFITNGRADLVTVFDLKTLAVTGEVPTGKNPDAIRYDPATRRVFAFNGGSDNATVINAADGKVVGTIELGGGPEFAVSDEKGNVFVNLEDKNEVLQIDAKKMTVKHRWPLAPGETPTGLAIDLRSKRLFVGCRNQFMVVVNAETGKVVTTLPIGKNVDGIAFDPATKLIFSSNGEGTLTVIRQESPDRYSLAETVKTMAGSRTLALDRKTHRVFLPSADFGPPPAPTPEHLNPRPGIIPGSFKVHILEN